MSQSLDLECDTLPLSVEVEGLELAVRRSPDDVRERAAPINPDFPFGLGGLRSGHAELLGGDCEGLPL